MSALDTQHDGPLDLSLRKKVIHSCNSPPFQQRVTRNGIRPALRCIFCGKCFDRPSLLKRHTRTHTGERPHVCVECRKGFSTSSSLNTHRRIHSGEKPHQCPTCGKRFTASSNLYYHRMTHSKVKPHKCNECPKSFPTPGDLRAHIYTHNGSWPFFCNACGRGFCKLANLRNHQQLHMRNGQQSVGSPKNNQSSCYIAAKLNYVPKELEVLSMRKDEEMLHGPTITIPKLAKSNNSDGSIINCQDTPDANVRYSHDHSQLKHLSTLERSCGPQTYKLISRYNEF